MSWATTAPAIKTLLETVSDVGNVYLGDRHLRDEARAKSLFSWVAAAVGRRPRVKGWFIARTSAEESWWSTLRTKATERYVLRAYGGLTKTTGSEAEHQALLDRTLEAFRNVDEIGTAHVIEAPSFVDVGWAEVGDLKCHYAEIEIEVEELYTIPVVTQVAGVNSLAAERDGYANVAEQLATYLALVDDEFQTHEERPYRETEAEVIDTFCVPSLSGAVKPYRFRCWRIWRQGTSEKRGLGQVVRADATWKLRAALGLRDAGDSYDDAQDFVDAARAVFRGVANLGNTQNPTLSISSPLQLKEFGAGMDSDVLVHFADCELTTEETVICTA